MNSFGSRLITPSIIIQTNSWVSRWNSTTLFPGSSQPKDQLKKTVRVLGEYAPSGRNTLSWSFVPPPPLTQMVPETRPHRGPTLCFDGVARAQYTCFWGCGIINCLCLIRLFNNFDLDLTFSRFVGNYDLELCNFWVWILEVIGLCFRFCASWNILQEFEAKIVLKFPQN